MRRAVVIMVAAACGGSGAAITPAAAPGGATAPMVVPSGNVPGAIAGRWRVTCAENDGDIIEVVVSGDKAVGRVVEPGAAARFGFRAGEEVFRLTLDPAGAWAGEVRWRGASGAQHWDGIVLVATPAVLSAKVTNEPCYREMRRAE